MGQRGKGAITKPKPEPKANGRPRNKGPREIIDDARAKAKAVVTFLYTTAMDAGQEMRYRIRAASELIRVAVLDYEDEAPITEEEQALVVKFEQNWGGAKNTTATNGKGSA